MPFCAVRGGVVHQRRDCPAAARVRRWRVVTDDEAAILRACAACHPTRCNVCLCADGPLHQLCGAHAACGECCAALVASHCHQSYGSAAPCCPYDGAPINLEALPARAVAPWIRALTERFSACEAELQRVAACSDTALEAVLVEHALTPRCPWCGRPFAAYDGCGAITCACGRHFCALCLAPQRGSDACHRHVQLCESNPERRLYPSLHVWRAQMRRRGARRVLERLDALTHSVGYWGVASLLSSSAPLNASVPWHERLVFYLTGCSARATDRVRNAIETLCAPCDDDDGCTPALPVAP